MKRKCLFYKCFCKCRKSIGLVLKKFIYYIKYIQPYIKNCFPHILTTGIVLKMTVERVKNAFKHSMEGF